MMSRLIRPMTIEDEQGDSITIDALDVTDFDVLNCMLTIDHKYQEHLHFPSKSNSEIFRMFNAKLYNALNAPVQVTQDVLDAMEKVPEAKFLMWDDYDNLVECRYNSKWRMREVNGVYLPVGAWLYIKVEEYSPSFSSERLAVDDLIQANCPLALQVLLQFYTDGTPIKGKETE